MFHALPVFDVDSLEDARLAPYRNLPDRELRAGGELFLVEGRLGVRRLLLESDFVPQSVFATPAACSALADALGALPPEAPVYRGDGGLLNRVVGYNLHRGCLAAAWRGEPRTPQAVAAACAAAGRPLLVLEKVDNPENVGNVFRNAVAFGAGGVWLSAGCADPLYRQATRVSMGGSLRVPFAWLPGDPGIPAALRAAGFESVALTPDPAAEAIGACVANGTGRALALLLGNEGAGLSDAVLRAADRRVRIPLAPGVDSLNVATASGIALHRLVGAPEA